MISVNVRLNKYRAKNDGSYPLVIQLIYRRKKRLISTPYHLYQECFDEKKKIAINHCGNKKYKLKEVNQFIKIADAEIKSIIDKLISEKKEFTVDDIVGRYKRKNSNAFLLPYMSDYMFSLNEQERFGSYNAYRSTTNRVKRFLNNDQEVCFEHITVSFLNSFVDSMIKDNISINTIDFYLRMFSAIYNRAALEGIEGIKYPSPFSKVTVRTLETTKRAVDVDTIRMIKNADLSFNPKMEMARDYFMMSFYARGMSLIDVVHLKKSDIIKGVIRYRRSKTKQLLQVKIVKQLEILMSKYVSDSEYVFPLLKSNEPARAYPEYRSALKEINKGLKKMSEHLGLPIYITSYVARHSWATIAKKTGVSMAIISESMGHKSEKTTKIYLASFDSEVLDSANQDIADFCS